MRSRKAATQGARRPFFSLCEGPALRAAGGPGARQWAAPLSGLLPVGGRGRLLGPAVVGRPPRFGAAGRGWRGRAGASACPRPVGQLREPGQVRLLVFSHPEDGHHAADDGRQIHQVDKDPQGRAARSWRPDQVRQQLQPPGGQVPRPIDDKGEAQGPAGSGGRPTRPFPPAGQRQSRPRTAGASSKSPRQTPGWDTDITPRRTSLFSRKKPPFGLQNIHSLSLRHTGVASQGKSRKMMTKKPGG